MRTLAVQVEDELFDALDDCAQQTGMSKKNFLTGILQSYVEQHKQQQQVTREETADDAPAPTENERSSWNKAEVGKAIENFIVGNGRPPAQLEFTSANGLPAYKTAKRALEQSPSEYSHALYNEMAESETETESEGMTMSM